MSIALEEVINAFPLVTPHLHQRGGEHAAFMCCWVSGAAQNRQRDRSDRSTKELPLARLVAWAIQSITCFVRLPTCLGDLRLVCVRVAMSGAHNFVQRNGSLAYMRFISLVFVYCLK
jgi:hypothetical protein